MRCIPCYKQLFSIFFSFRQIFSDVFKNIFTFNRKLLILNAIIFYKPLALYRNYVIYLYGTIERVMNIIKINIRGTEMNKMQFSEIDYLLEKKGLDVNEVFNMIADDKEMVYVSNGFLSGLNAEENEIGEWHHYFKKSEDGSFEAGKLKFN